MKPRAPKASSPAVTRSMKANKSKGTKPELFLKMALCSHGFHGYRLNWKQIPGSPDVCFPKQKLAVFINGCFWHGCAICKRNLTPSKNSVYWKAKIKRNKLRDKKVISTLKELGWKTHTIWEHALKKEPQAAILDLAKIIGLLKKKKRRA